MESRTVRRKNLGLCARLLLYTAVAGCGSMDDITEQALAGIANTKLSQAHHAYIQLAAAPFDWKPIGFGRDVIFESNNGTRLVPSSGRLFGSLTFKTSRIVGK